MPSQSGRGPGATNLFCSVIAWLASRTTLGLLAVVMAVLGPRPVEAAPVPVRFAEGVTHGFLILRTIDDVVIASGDLLQVARGAEVESRMVFRFKDGSLFDETVVFGQQHVFTMQSYHLIQRGPAFQRGN